MAIVMVSCEKSGRKPSCHSNHHVVSDTSSVSGAKEINSNSSNSTLGARSVKPSDEEGQPDVIVGSGDDDRDGGDKGRRKK